MGIHCDSATKLYFEYREQAATTAPTNPQEITMFLTSNALHTHLT